MYKRVSNFFVNGFDAMKIQNIDDIKSMYQGNVPLVYVFWIFGFVILGIIDITHRIFAYGASAIENQILAGFFLLSDYLILSIYIPLCIFSMIVSWRSANKYTGRTVWRRLTKFLVVFSCVMYTFAILANIFLPSVIEELKRQNQVYSAENNSVNISTSNNNIELSSI